MKSFSVIKNRLNETWENFSEGWNKLSHLSRSALTRFSHSTKKRYEKNTQENPLQQWSHGIGWSLLPVDLYEDNDFIHVRLEVPGLSSDDLDVRVAGDQLIIEGNKKLKREEVKDQFYLMECAYGSFSRVIPLPCKVKDSEAKASYKHGVLNITLPKSNDVKKIKILVQ
jgi:HSP20 family protein